MEYRFYGKKSKGNYKYIMLYDNDDKVVNSFIILEQHLIEVEPLNYKICICSDMKSREQIWFKCTYFDVDEYEITYCDAETKQEYEGMFGEKFEKNAKKYI